MDTRRRLVVLDQRGTRRRLVAGVAFERFGQELYRRLINNKFEARSKLPQVGVRRGTVRVHVPTINDVQHQVCAPAVWVELVQVTRIVLGLHKALYLHELLFDGGAVPNIMSRVRFAEQRL
eukprot:6174558-Pleurochrysis_carterae.AAC.3